MKKLVSLLIALVLCLCAVAPVYASEFVPSIPEKDIVIVPGEDDEGNPTIGRIIDKDGTPIAFVYLDCLVVTPISKAETAEKIPDDARALLLSVYEQLVSGAMELPYHKFSENVDPSTMVIRDLVDISWLCEDHPALLASSEYYLELTFALGVDADVFVYVMNYKNDDWNPIASTTNNGDGTVTCLFRHLCPVSFSVSNVNYAPPQTGDTANLTLWITLMAVSVVALGALVVVLKKSSGRAAR